MALPSATFNGQQIVTSVSRFTGLANDTNSRPAVLDYVNLGLWQISLETPWGWNEIIGSNITVTAGVADYALPTAAGLVFDDIYDVRLTGGPGPERSLMPMDRRTYDRGRPGVQSGQTTPTHYLIYGAEQNAVLTLVPTPNAGNVLVMRYIGRQASISDATASSLNVPDKYVPMVIYKGAELVSAWKAPERVNYWNGMYKQTLQRALQMSRESPDDVPTMVPRIQGGWFYDQMFPNDLEEFPR